MNTPLASWKLGICLVMVMAATTAVMAADKPLKVFILAGQSNMQGHASIATFDSMADDPKTAPLLKEMRGPDGKPKVCEKVWITSVGCLGDAYTDLREKKGKLTAGFGAPENKIGPEFTFGFTMEKLLGEPILIIKTSWGGRSLHTDFRPPSAGPYVWSDYELVQHKRRGDDLEKAKAEKVKATGVYYREMIAHVRTVLKDIKRVVPEYDEKQGYELAGFVWFQGFNDYVSSWTYDQQMKPGGYDLYGGTAGAPHPRRAERPVGSQNAVRDRRDGDRRCGEGEEAANVALPPGPDLGGVTPRVQGQRRGCADGTILGRRVGLAARAHVQPR